MKQLIPILALLALPWTVGAQDGSSQITMEERMVRTFERYDKHLKHESALWAYLDSLYRASRETQDSMRYDTIVFDNGDTALLLSKYPVGCVRLYSDITVYIREYIPLDSVPITICDTTYIEMISGGPDHERVTCKTIGWRVTKQRVTERRVK